MALDFDIGKAFEEWLKSLSITGVGDRVYPVNIPEHNRVNNSEQTCLVYVSDGYSFPSRGMRRNTLIEHEYTLRVLGDGREDVASIEREIVRTIDSYSGTIGTDSIVIQRVTVNQAGADEWEPDKQLRVRRISLTLHYPI